MKKKKEKEVNIKRKMRYYYSFQMIFLCNFFSLNIKWANK